MVLIDLIDTDNQRDLHSDVPKLISDQHLEQSTLLTAHTMSNPNRPSEKAYWLQSNSMRKSLPLRLNPKLTAEDDDISSLRTFRYLKLDASNDGDLPCPRKFVQSSKPAQSRLRRSQSVYDFSASTESDPSPACQFQAHSPAFDSSSSACLRASLLLDDFQLLRPPSVASFGEALMFEPGHNEGADQAASAFC
jgi:hypothetical protein